MPIPWKEVERAEAERERLYAFFKKNPGLAYSEQELRDRGFDPGCLKPSGFLHEKSKIVYYWHPDEGGEKG